MSSFNPRSIRRTRSYAGDFRRNQRSAVSPEKRWTACRPLELIDLPGMNSTQQRPKTAVSRRMRSAQAPLEQIHSDEIEKLVRSSDRDEKSAVRVDCLGNYRRLIQAINLRATPFSSQLLCSLQQRENRIVQENACRDTRFSSLMDSLQAPYRASREKRDVLSIGSPYLIGVI